MHGPLEKQFLNFSPRLHPSILISRQCTVLMYMCVHVFMYNVCIDRYRHPSKHDMLKQWCFNVGPVCVDLMWVQPVDAGPALDQLNSDRHLTLDAFPLLLILTVHKHYITCTCRWPSRLSYFFILVGGLQTCHTPLLLPSLRTYSWLKVP